MVALTIRAARLRAISIRATISVSAASCVFVGFMDLGRFVTARAIARASVAPAARAIF